MDVYFHQGAFADEVLHSRKDIFVMAYDGPIAIKSGTRESEAYLSSNFIAPDHINRDLILSGEK